MLARGLGRLCRLGTSCPYQSAGLFLRANSRLNQACIYNGPPPALTVSICSYHGRRSPRRGNAYVAKSKKDNNDEQAVPEESAPTAEKDGKTDAGENKPPTEGDRAPEDSNEAKPRSSSNAVPPTLPMPQAAQGWMGMFNPLGWADAWRRFKVRSSTLIACIHVVEPRMCTLPTGRHM